MDVLQMLRPELPPKKERDCTGGMGGKDREGAGGGGDETGGTDEEPDADRSEGSELEKVPGAASLRAADCLRERRRMMITRSPMKIRAIQNTVRKLPECVWVFRAGSDDGSES